MERLLLAAAGLAVAACATEPPQWDRARAGAGPGGGCWVHAYGQTQYRPPLTTYTGPSHEAFPLGEARSLVVGPNAMVEGYAGWPAGEKRVVLPPGALVSDLRAGDFHADVDAFRLLCVSGGPSRDVALERLQQ